MHQSELSDNELSAYFALRAAGDRVQRAVAGHLRRHDLTEVQFAVLAQVSAASPHMRMSDLAEILVVSKSGLTYQVDRLADRGLLERRASETDDRTVLVELTPTGVEVLAEVMPGHVEVVREVFFDRINSHELETIRTGLGKVAGTS